MRAGRIVTVAWVLGVCACGGSVGASSDRPNAAGGPDAGDGAAPGDGAGGAAGPADPLSAVREAESVARRLSRAELDNALRDLLGDDTAPANRLLSEDAFAPYDNDYPSQVASGALIDSLEGMARDVSRHVVDDPVLRPLLVPCTPSGPGDAVCFRTVVEGFGERAFRRPLAPSEIDAYMTLLAFATENNPDVPHDFYTAVSLLVQSVLQDPEFLYRIEVGKGKGDGVTFALNDYEIATRMAFLLWGTTPDDALLADAKAGRLSDAKARDTVARRMLKDPRAREQLHRFHAMWLGYRALPHPAELTSAFQRETTALLDRVVFDEKQSYLNLFTFDETYVDDTLADHYGLPKPSGGQGWVAYGATGRAGILSHGSVLSAFSKFTDTSPTQRGKFIRTRLLCQEIPRPPANVMADKPPSGMDAVCKYDRYLEHRTSSSCAGCHEQMDPIGFGLERFDIAGRYRETDDGLPQCAITGQGEVVGYGKFSGPGELGKLLLDAKLVDGCIVRQVAQFAFGRAPNTSETKLVEALRASFENSGYAFDELLLAFVGEDAFAMRREPGTP